MAESKAVAAGYTAILTIGAATCGAATDASLKASCKAVDVSRRSGAGHKEFIPGLLSWSLSHGAVYIHDDAGLLLLLSAGTIKKTIIALTLKDADGYGFSGNAFLTSIKESVPLNGSPTWAVELKGSGALTRVTPT
jgi:predicted secreted protein